MSSERIIETLICRKIYFVRTGTRVNKE